MHAFINQGEINGIATCLASWPNKEIVNNVFMVTGANVVFYEGTRLQTSRNMVIVRQGNELTLINTIRLNDEGLKSLNALGKIKNIIRIGAFHGRDDAFYQKQYHANLWAFPAMEFSHGERVDFDLSKHDLPIRGADVITFSSTKFPEALILLNQDGGILISCDSVKNWRERNYQYFDDKTFDLMRASGSIGEALIDNTWLEAMHPSKEEISRIPSLDFVTLISAHGPPIIKTAKHAVEKSVQKAIKKLGVTVPNNTLKK